STGTDTLALSASTTPISSTPGSSAWTSTSMPRASRWTRGRTAPSSPTSTSSSTTAPPSGRTPSWWSPSEKYQDDAPAQQVIIYLEGPSPRSARGLLVAISAYSRVETSWPSSSGHGNARVGSWRHEYCTATRSDCDGN